MEQTKKQHSLLVEDNKIQILGIISIKQSDEKVLSVKLTDRTLTITGDGLNITKLDLEEGKLCADGKTQTTKYSNGGLREPLLKRLFK
jgi:hypothetical protein